MSDSPESPKRFIGRKGSFTDVPSLAPPDRTEGIANVRIPEKKSIEENRPLRKGHESVNNRPSTQTTITSDWTISSEWTAPGAVAVPGIVSGLPRHSGMSSWTPSTQTSGTYEPSSAINGSSAAMGSFGDNPSLPLTAQIVPEDYEIVERVERQILQRLEQGRQQQLAYAPGRSVAVSGSAVQVMSPLDSNETTSAIPLLSKKPIFWVMVVVALLVVIGAGVGAGLALSGDDKGNGEDADRSSVNVAPTSATPSISPVGSEFLPTVPGPPSPSPSTNPTAIPTAEPTSKPFVYTESQVAPNTTRNFDHMEMFGFLPSDESNIEKISQVKVFTENVCLNNDCATVRTILNLVTTYLLKDCTSTSQTNGAYTGNESNLVATINFLNGVYITRIELFTDEYVSHIKICSSSGECSDRYGASLEMEPNVLFEKSNSVVKAFYGSSGSWLDALGVYYEDARTSTNTCA